MDAVPPSSPFPQATWRILRTPPMSGSWNMAIDEALLESAARGSSLPTLRLFAWQPACLSLGYAQPFSDVDAAALSRNQWQQVRRPTGGRAILHTDELTYSVTAPLNEARVAGSVLQSYCQLAQALLAALQHLGLAARSEDEYPRPAGHPAAGGPVCFETPSNYEITANGKKIIGSAQARRLGCVLQHGSLPLDGDLTRVTRALHFAAEADRAQAAARLLAHAATAENILGFAPTWQQAAQAFEAGFASALNLRWAPGELTAAEQQRAAQLVEEKYAADPWTQRV